MPPRAKNPNASTTTTIRTTNAIRDLLAAHGHGNLSEGLRVLVGRLQGIMRRELPAFGLEDCKAIMGALKGYPLWAEPEIGKSMRLGPALALEVHDYPECEPGEAEQWHVDWKDLAARCEDLIDIQVMALGHAVAEAYADRAEPHDLDSLVKRHFRIPRPAGPAAADA